MKMYAVTVPEVHNAIYNVEAASEEEAIEEVKAMRKYGEEEDFTEYSRTFTSDTWTVVDVQAYIQRR